MRKAINFLSKLDYCFTEPSVKPLTKCFWTSNIKIKAGIIAAVPKAAILSQAVPVDVTKEVETTGIVFRPVCVSISTKMNYVQLKIKHKTAVAAIPPIAKGAISLLNT